MRLNSVSYSAIGSNCPSQNIQPTGAIVPANIRISPIYGCAMQLRLLLSGYDAWTGNTPTNAMQNDTVRNGCMFRCAWLLPSLLTDEACSAVSGASALL